MAEKKDKSLVGNEKIEQDIRKLKEEFTDENLAVVLTTIRKRSIENGQFVVAVDATKSSEHLMLKTATFNGKKWFVAYTSFEEEMKGQLNVVSCFLADIAQLLDMAKKSNEVEGIILNPYGDMITLNKQILEVIS